MSFRRPNSLALFVSKLIRSALGLFQKNTASPGFPSAEGRPFHLTDEEAMRPFPRMASDSREPSPGLHLFAAIRSCLGGLILSAGTFSLQLLRLCRMCLPAVFVLLLVATPPAPAPARELVKTTGSATAIEEVRHYLLLGEYDQALALLEEAVVPRPDYADAIAYLGYLLWMEGDQPGAEALVQRSLSLRPERPLGHYFLGVLRRSQWRLAEAISEFERVIDLDPENGPAFVELGRTLVLGRDYGAAAAALERAVYTAPDNLGYRLQLARFYLDHALWLDRALAAAGAAVELNPESAEALDVYGWALWANGRPYDARHSLEAAVAADSNLAGAHYHLAVLLENTGDIPSAVAEYRRVLQLDANGPYFAGAQAALAALIIR